MARALMGKQVGDSVSVYRPKGEVTFEVAGRELSGSDKVSSPEPSRGHCAIGTAPSRLGGKNQQVLALFVGDRAADQDGARKAP